MGVYHNEATRLALHMLIAFLSLLLGSAFTNYRQNDRTPNHSAPHPFAFSFSSGPHVLILIKFVIQNEARARPC